MKYVVMEKDGVAMPLALIFGGALTHLEVAQPFTPSGWKPTSAGFCTAVPGSHAFHCWGKSKTLGLSFKAGDAELLHALAALTNNTSDE